MEGHSWQQADLAKLFLEGVRGAIPLAAVQMDLFLRVVRKACPRIQRLLDLGCGDGILGRAVLSEHPATQGLFLDFSEPMLTAARQKVAGQGLSATFALCDFSRKSWVDNAAMHGPFDLIVSGFAIHHQPDVRKREIYGEIFDLLAPGGLFLHQEHVSSGSIWARELFDEMFVESLWQHHQQHGATRSREEIANEYYYRPDKAENILAPVDLQCRWLAELGFIDVDCFFKLFEAAIFGGRKPQ